MAAETKETPLFLAVKNNHIECAKLLLQFGSNPKIMNLRLVWRLISITINRSQVQDMRWTHLFQETKAYRFGKFRAHAGSSLTKHKTYIRKDMFVIWSRGRKYVQVYVWNFWSLDWSYTSSSIAVAAETTIPTGFPMNVGESQVENGAQVTDFRNMEEFLDDEL